MTTLATPSALPAWAAELSLQYTSSAANQFILHGNTDDRFLLPTAPMTKPAPGAAPANPASNCDLGNLTDFLLRVLLPKFDVVLSYDLGNGIRIEKGQGIFADWPALKDSSMSAGGLPKTPRAAIETLTHYFRYAANLARINRGSLQVACIVKAAHLLAPNMPGGANYDLSAIALLIRDWSTDTALVEHTLATILLTENLNDVAPLLVTNNRACRLPVPLPTAADLTTALAVIGPRYPKALANYAGQYDSVAGQLVGASLVSIESLLRTREHAGLPIAPADLVALKKTLVEDDANGLIEFIEPTKTLDDLYGQEKIKAHIRQDLALWKNNDLAALPMGYLLAGPVGTGKTFMVNCIAGEAGVPVVKFKNFRDKWVGSTEGNLEKIFRLLSALGRCFVFIDEADQALGKRDASSGDSGVGGRVYSMFAEEMSRTANRGKIIWVLASSRPDLIEVDLKRPGRVDVKIPLFPTTTPAESYQLLRALLKRMGVIAPEVCPDAVSPHIPDLLTPGTAEALAIKAYRLIRTTTPAPAVDAVLLDILDDYQSPIPPEVMAFQIDLAVKEASDLDFVPARFRKRPT